MTSRTALIAGAGLAGLATALHLDEQGYQVTLFERKPILGGRTYSYTDRITGQTIDNGQHLLVGAYHHTLRFLERVGATHKLTWQIPSRIVLADTLGKKNVFALRNTKSPLNLGLALGFFGGMGFRDKARLLGLARTLKQIKQAKETGIKILNQLKGLTVAEWLNQYHQSQEARANFWNILTLATLNDTLEQAPAEAMVQVLLASYFAGPRDGFLILPKTGLSQLFAEPAKAYLELRGHQIITGCGLSEIRILDNKVQCFKTQDGREHKADLYVSGLTPRALLSVLANPFVTNHPTLCQVPHITGSPIVSVNLFFDRPFMTEPFIGAANTTMQWIFNKGVCKKTSVHHVVAVISAADALLEKTKDQMIGIALADLHKLYPQSQQAKLVHALVSKDPEATLKFTPASNQKRPNQRVLENFWVVGDWTNTGLPPTIESAVKSAALAISPHLN